MANQAEPMDIDDISDFDNKENSLLHSNVLSQQTDKGYEELDVSELNMKLRWSNSTQYSPNSSVMSKSYTANLPDNRSQDAVDVNNTIINECGNLSQSLSSKSDSVLKTPKLLPLQVLPSDQFVDVNRNASVLRSLDGTVTLDTNVTLTVTESGDNDDNYSSESSSVSPDCTPEATTPVKDIPKPSGSPILRGIKSVLNLFRPSQSPIPLDEAETQGSIPEVLSCVEGVSPVKNEDSGSQCMLASTPIATHKDKDSNGSKRSSPLKESLVFNEDLKKELEWKEDSTIIFSHKERVPIHKLFFQQPTRSVSPENSCLTKDTVNFEPAVSNQGDTMEPMDISYNDSILKDKTITHEASVMKKSKDISLEVDKDESEFLDCETTFNNDSQLLNITKDKTAEVAELEDQNDLPEEVKEALNVTKEITVDENPTTPSEMKILTEDNDSMTTEKLQRATETHSTNEVSHNITIPCQDVTYCSEKPGQSDKISEKISTISDISSTSLSSLSCKINTQLPSLSDPLELEKSNIISAISSNLITNNVDSVSGVVTENVKPVDVTLDVTFNTQSLTISNLPMNQTLDVTKCAEIPLPEDEFTDIETDDVEDLKLDTFIEEEIIDMCAKKSSDNIKLIETVPETDAEPANSMVIKTEQCVTCLGEKSPIIESEKNTLRESFENSHSVLENLAKSFSNIVCNTSDDTKSNKIEEVAETMPEILTPSEQNITNENANNNKNVSLVSDKDIAAVNELQQKTENSPITPEVETLENIQQYSTEPITEVNDSTKVHLTSQDNSLIHNDKLEPVNISAAEFNTINSDICQDNVSATVIDEAKMAENISLAENERSNSKVIEMLHVKENKTEPVHSLDAEISSDELKNTSVPELKQQDSEAVQSDETIVHTTLLKGMNDHKSNSLIETEEDIEVAALEEELIFSENNSPYVSLTAPEDLPNPDNAGEFKNEFATTDIPVSSSPPICSKGYNINFDEVDNIGTGQSQNAFATQIDIPVSSSPPICSKGYNINFDEVDNAGQFENAFVTQTAIPSSPPICSKGYNINFDEIDSTDNTEQSENAFATQTNVPMSSSPPISSKGYNINFDEVDNEGRFENPFATQTNVPMSSSPPICSKGYNINFDEMENPFVSKTNIEASPDRQTFEPIDKVPPNLILPTEPIKPEANVTICFEDMGHDNLKSDLPNEVFSTIVDEADVDIAINKTIEDISLAKQIITQDFEPKINTEAKEAIDDFVLEERKIEMELSSSLYADIKNTSSSEKSAFYSAETSSGEGLEPQPASSMTDSIECNPFVTKSKIRQTPPPGLDNPFATKSKIRQSPPPKCEMETSFVVKNVERQSSSNPEEENPFLTKTKIATSPNTSFIVAKPETSRMLVENPMFQQPIEKSGEENIMKDVNETNVNSTISSESSNGINETVREVNTEDEDTAEGPFIEADLVHKDDQITAFIPGKVEGSQLTDFPPQDSDENFEAAGEMFIDANTFDFLMNQNKSSEVADSGKESLFLKFDPLFAKRVNSDGIVDVLTNLKKRQSTPKKIRQTPPQDLMFLDKSPVAGPSNVTSEENTTNESSSEDLNVTVAQKPTMVVPPAVNPVGPPRKKSSTPVRSSNRLSMNFTSPALAVIDRLLSLSANNSPASPERSPPTNTENLEAERALMQLRELLAEKELNVHHLRCESKELKDRFAVLDSQMKSLESESDKRLKNIDELNEKLAEKNQENKNMAAVVEEYERTIAGLIAAIEEDKRKHAEERIQLITDRDEQTAHLASMEVAFSDLHSKYEKSKQLIMSYKEREDTFKKTVQEFKDNFTKVQNNYELLKQHATSQLNHANQELEKMNRIHEAEVLKLNAMIKRKDLHICSLEETLAQKTKANDKLTVICDELISKVGRLN